MAKCYASKVIKVAKSYVGYQEKASNKNLEKPHANVGKNNYTIFGKKRGCNGQPWCDAFVDECFIEAYGEKEAKRLLGGFSNYTPTSAQNFKDMGRYYKRGETTPKVGDEIFFWSNSLKRIAHTGKVYKVDKANKKVYTIEGNTSSNSTKFSRDGGCVAYKVYSFNDPRIDGYGRPDYDTVPKVKTKLSCRLYKHMNQLKGSYATLSKGVGVTFIKDMGNGWSKCKYNGKTGYIKNTALSKSGLSTYPTVTVTKKAAFRKKNSIKSTSMKTLKVGTKVKRIHKGKTWSLCIVDDIKGYIATSKLK